MNDRLLKLITYLGYTATKFADEIGVQRSGISHILSGRNQPSYDFFVKIMTKFPTIDAEWLLLGKGTMIKTQKPEIIHPTINQNNPQTTRKEPDLINQPPANGQYQIQYPSAHNKVTSVTSIQRIIVLNTDGTFDHYNPAKKD